MAVMIRTAGDPMMLAAAVREQVTALDEDLPVASRRWNRFAPTRWEGSDSTLGEGTLLALVGVAIGLAGAFALTRLISRLLFGVSPTDFVTFAVVSLLLFGVALLASYIPARRAMNVDPMVALRSE